MKRVIFITLISLAMATHNALAAEGKKVDYLSLAALMIHDGFYDRAAEALNNITITEDNKDKIDLVRFYTLRGIVQLERKQFEAAKQDIEAAIAAGQTEPKVYLYLARAEYGLEQWQATLDALDKAGDAAKTAPGAFSMRAQAYWNLEQHENAWQALKEGRDAFPDHYEFLRQQVFFLIDLGLFQDAVVYGQEYLSNTEGSEVDYLAIGSALRKAHQFQEALLFMEDAKLRFPDSENVIIELAHVYIDMERDLTAAELFDEAAKRNPALVSEASELFRRAHKLIRSLALNAQIVDQKEKFKQRLAILLELENYEMIANMDGTMLRVGLLENEDIRYALAYAHYQIGDFGPAEEHLKFLTRGDLFRKAAQLRKSMEECKNDYWLCH